MAEEYVYYDPEDEYNRYTEKKEEGNSFFSNIPRAALVVLSVIFLLFIGFVWDTETKYKIGVAVVTIIAVIIILALGNKTTHKEEFLSEGQAVAIVQEYLREKQRVTPELERCRLEIGSCHQMREWDGGRNEGFKPWRWCISVNKVLEGIVKERFSIFVHPYEGKIIGTERLGTKMQGNEKPNIKVVFPFNTRASEQFKDDVRVGRTRW